MELNNTFTWLWLAWGGLFVVIEGAALLNKKRGDTLSEHIWFLRSRKVGRFVVPAFLGWLAYHFLVEGPGK